MKLLVFSLKARVNPAVAEAFAALRAAEFCRNWGLDKIISEGDSLQVVNALNRPGQNWSMNGQIRVSNSDYLEFSRSSCFEFLNYIFLH
jgi:ribonuclease HI